jgi:CTP synthase (UTP-ammonia lyase)
MVCVIDSSPPDRKEGLVRLGKNYLRVSTGSNTERVREGTFSSMMARYRYRYILQPGTVRNKMQLGFNRSYFKLQELVLDFTVQILV